LRCLGIFYEVELNLVEQSVPKQALSSTTRGICSFAFRTSMLGKDSNSRGKAGGKLHMEQRGDAKLYLLSPRRHLPQGRKRATRAGEKKEATARGGGGGGDSGFPGEEGRQLVKRDRESPNHASLPPNRRHRWRSVRGEHQRSEECAEVAFSRTWRSFPTSSCPWPTGESMK
jgi:hypothetical protein